MIRKILGFCLFVALLAVPLAFFVGLIDPVGHPDFLFNYALSVPSVFFTLIILGHLSAKSEYETLCAMLSDGLTDKEVIRLVGQSRFENMLRAGNGVFAYWWG